MRAEHNPPPENVTIDSLAKGESFAPDSLKEFKNLIHLKNF